MTIFSDNEKLYKHHRASHSINTSTLEQRDDVKETNKYSPTISSADSIDSIIEVNGEIQYIRTAKRSNFEDAFGEKIYNLSYERNRKIRYTYTPGKKDVWISNCVFYGCSNSECGGAFSSTSIERVFFEESTFFGCTTKGRMGGAIYFVNEENGQCVISRTSSEYCQTQCVDSAGGQFAYISTKRDTSYKNEVNESIITKSQMSSEYSMYALELRLSRIICSSINITYNTCNYYPALFSYPSEDADAITCFIVCASIVNNSAQKLKSQTYYGYGCIYIGNSMSRQLILTSNILYNKHEFLDDESTICSYAYLFINESCILDNEAKYLFYQGNGESQIIITGCILDGDFNTYSRHLGWNRVVGGDGVVIISTKEYSLNDASIDIINENCSTFYDSFVSVEKTKKVITCFCRKTNNAVFVFLQNILV